MRELNVSKLSIDPRLLTSKQKIALLSARAFVCDKTAAKALRGEPIKGDAGERCHIVIRELGLVPQPTK